MEFFFLVVFVLVVVAIAAKFGAAGASQREYPYEKEPHLLTPAERSFFGVLKLALADTLVIFAKVRVADVMKTRKGLDNKERAAAFNRIAKKHFDFVLCDPNDLSVVAAIELDDKSHGSRKRADRDKFLEGACESAGIELHRFPAAKSYTVEGILAVVMGHPLHPAKDPQIDSSVKTIAD